MPISPRAGSRLAYGQRKSWLSSSGEGTLNPLTRTPCGLRPVITWRIVPSLPPASSAWSTTSTPCVACAASRAWYSASRATPCSSRATPSFLRTPALNLGSKSDASLTREPGLPRRGSRPPAILSGRRSLMPLYRADELEPRRVGDDDRSHLTSQQSRSVRDRADRGEPARLFDERAGSPDLGPHRALCELRRSQRLRGGPPDRPLLRRAPARVDGVDVGHDQECVGFESRREECAGEVLVDDGLDAHQPLARLRT